MNFADEYETVKRELGKVNRHLSQLEEDGLYGTTQYANAAEKQANLEDELECLEAEMDR